jgi:hypothetical protein
LGYDVRRGARIAGLMWYSGRAGELSIFKLQEIPLTGSGLSISFESSKTFFTKSSEFYEELSEI